MNWHTAETEDIFKELKTSAGGLSEADAALRYAEHGTNELKGKKKKSAIIMLLEQFTDFMILVLIAAAVIAGIIGEPVDAAAILVIVIINAVMGFTQEQKAEKAIEALQKMASPSAFVIRDGHETKIPASMIVPGDIVLLETGAIVPADMRIITSSSLKIEEAALTGESVSSEKNPGKIEDADAVLADRKNMAYKGTMVSYGRGTGVVTATGMNTELGKIASMLQDEKEEKTPLQKKMISFGKYISIAVLGICAVVFVTGILRGEEPMRMFLTAVSLAVAAIPEALPAVITISLALGAGIMAEKNALIRKLPAVETLGSVTYICSDKTGTLTVNKMTVEKYYSGGIFYEAKGTDKPDSVFMTAVALSNDSRKQAEGKTEGEPTENALYESAAEFGFVKEELVKLYPRVAEIPFDSDRKCMTTFHKNPEGGFISFTKGASDSILAVSDLMSAGGKTAHADKTEIDRVNDEMADNGLRIIAFACRYWNQLPEVITPENAEKDLIFLGLAAMIDPPRQEAAEAVRIALKAGIKPVMITGDHPSTAKAIAVKLGIAGADDGVMTGAVLKKLPEDEFLDKVESIKVYARVAPEQKLMIVKALQAKGQYAAMTGDGVNDAPALKKADIGIAMGITGTDVSKQAAHMILLDDNFATIVGAVKQGRIIYDNIRKFIKYLLTTNSGEIWTLFLAPFMGLPVPLLPIHILWINLVTDSLPALALTKEPGEKDIMDRPPRSPKENIFSHGLGAHAIWVGVLMGGVVLAIQAWAIHIGDSHWQTMVFTVLCLTQLGHVMAIRSEKQSVFKQGIFSNILLLGSIILVFALQMLTIYVPFLNDLFKTQPLSLKELGICVAASSVVFIAVELEKMIKRIIHYN
ncbi:MAG TPA: cation-translocating P-type ATPase [Candidatus Goldiibacteriota bacterium]|nr:cation-translocating P-type ATPase [Candidatus Goldiibacteriota bacterium]HRQ43201.1 cation-translocating P-type ATPase [Candidatus Goldiibacteriota bacterium]